MALSLLLAGAAASAKKDNDTNAAGSPSSAASSGPRDQQACDSASAIALLAGFRLAGVSILVELAGTDAAKQEKALKDAAANLTLVTTSADEAIAKTSDAEMKAAITEFKTMIVKIQTALGTSASDPAKLSAELEKAAEELEKTEKKIAVLCPKTSPSPSTSDGPMGRKETCKEFEALSFAQGFVLFGAYAKLYEAGSDKSKIDAALKELNPAIDELASALMALAAKTTDAEMKTALREQVAQLTKMKTALAQAAKDPKRLKDLLQDGPGGSNAKAVEDKLEALCESK